MSDFDAMQSIVDGMRKMTARFALANRAMAGEEILVVTDWRPPSPVNIPAHRAAYCEKVGQVYDRVIRDSHASS